MTDSDRPYLAAQDEHELAILKAVPGQIRAVQEYLEKQEAWYDDVAQYMSARALDETLDSLKNVAEAEIKQCERRQREAAK